MDWPTNPTPSQAQAMRRIGNEYARRAFAFGDPDPNRLRAAPRPVTGPLTPMQEAALRGTLPPPRAISPSPAMMPRWAPTAASLVSRVGLASYIPQLAVAAVDGYGSSQPGFNPTPTAAEQQVAQVAPYPFYPGFKGRHDPFDNGLDSNMTVPHAAFNANYGNEGRNYPAPTPPPAMYDDHGHMTPANPIYKQAMERPKLIAKQRERQTYGDQRGAGMTLQSSTNGIREYTSPMLPQQYFAPAEEDQGLYY
jgi:hypothetical protein